MYLLSTKDFSKISSIVEMAVACSPFLINSFNCFSISLYPLGILVADFMLSCFSFINAIIFFGATELEKIEESYDGWNPMGNCEPLFWNNTIFVIFRHRTFGL